MCFNEISRQNTINEDLYRINLDIHCSIKIRQQKHKIPMLTNVCLNEQDIPTYETNLYVSNYMLIILF